MLALILTLYTLLVTHTHTQALWNLDLLSRSQQPFLFSQDGNVCHRIKQLPCVHVLVCYVNSFLEKLMCGKMLCQGLLCVLVSQQLKSMKLNCVFTFLYWVFVKDGQRQKRLLSSLFSIWSRLSWSNRSSTVSSQWPWRLYFWGYAASFENLRILWR